MKKLIPILTACSISIAALPPITALADDAIKIYLNGAQLEFDAPPVIMEGTTFVPMRKIFEALGAVVQWQADTMTVIASTPGIILDIPIGSSELHVNTLPLTTETPAFISEGSTFVPLRLVSEYMGCSVQWDSCSQSVYINSSDRIQKLYWNDNYYYVGNTSDGKASGYGMLFEINTDNVVHIGWFENDGIKDGTIYYPDGTWFYGQYTAGHFNGYGELHTASGDVYTGYFENDALNGYGKVTYATGSVYEGNWKDNHKDGYGKQIYTDGSIYEGDWVNGVMSGQGIYYFSDGSTYTGSFADNKFNGQGVRIYSDGSYYDGEWLNDLWNGYGEFYYAFYEASYIGYFIDGKKNGLFTVYDHALDTYTTGTYADDIAVQGPF